MAGYAGRSTSRYARRGPEPTVSRALLFILVGLAFLAFLTSPLLRALQLEGHPGTLTVASCSESGGSHPVITCGGDFRLNSGGPVRVGAEVSERQSYPAGTQLKVQQSSDGSLQAVDSEDQILFVAGALVCLAFAGLGVRDLRAALRRRRWNRENAWNRRRPTESEAG